MGRADAKRAIHLHGVALIPMSSSPSLPVALTIAGSDSSSGAGMQADLKAFAAHGVYGLCAVTSVVAEIPGRVVAWEPVDPTLLGQQLNTVASGFPIAAAKTGMLATPELVGETCDFLWKHRGAFPVVVDPVMVASSGDRLLVEEAIAGYRELLLPMAAVATPIVLYLLGLPDVAGMFAVMSALVLWKHKENIQRLRMGTESKIGAKK